MLAVEISRHGGPDVLVPVDRADPVPPRGEVLVCNRWVGVNYVDLQHREGRPYPVTLPLVPGTEAAGTIVAVGPGLDAGLVGTPVVHFGHLAGVYAELTAVLLDYVVPLPPDTPLDVAAAVALSGTTAHVLTSAAHRVGPGDVVVVHAAAGATGGAVVQRAAAAGADVIAIASTAEKAAAATTLGAGHAIALRETPDPVAAVMSASGGQGADVVYDATGRDTFEASLAMLATRGTLVLYGQSSGPVRPFDPGRLSGITGDSGSAGSLTLRWVAASHYLSGPHERARALTQPALGQQDPQVPGAGLVGLGVPLAAASRSGVGRLAHMRGDPGRGQLLGDIPPPRAPLHRERDIAAAGEPHQPGPQAHPVSRRDLAAPRLPGHGAGIVEGQLLPVNIQPAYDRHRDLLKLRRGA